MNEVKKPRKPLMFYYAMALLAIVLFNSFLAPLLFSPRVTEVDYSEFMRMTQDKKITEVMVQNTRAKVVTCAMKTAADHSCRVLEESFDGMQLKTLAEASGGKLAVSSQETREYYGVAVDKRRPDVLAAANAVIAEMKGGAK